MADVALSDYEQQRLEHMKRNHEYMVLLGLKKASDPIAPNHHKAKRVTTHRAKRKRGEEGVVRRSLRLAGEEAELDGEAVAALDDDDDDILPEAVGRSEAMESLKAVRAAVLSVAPCETPDAWRAEAVRRWGPAAGAGKADRDWKTFVEARLSSPPPVSPLEFLQEFYAADVWRLLVACILMSRVSSADTKHRCISDFFAQYPTPSAFAKETEWSNVKKAIHSLGLFDDRLKSLVALTDHFLQGAEVDGERLDTFDVDTDRTSPHKIHGIGPFGRDSYLVFCKDQGPTIHLSPGGKPIEAFVKWRKS